MKIIISCILATICLLTVNSMQYAFSEDADDLVRQGYDILYSEQDLQQTMQMFDKALEIDPKNTSALIGKGTVSYLLGEPVQAIAWCDKALEIDPKNTSALLWKGRALDSLGEPVQAIAWFDKVLRIDPYHKAAHESRFAAFSKPGELEKKIIWYDKYLGVTTVDITKVDDDDGVLLLLHPAAKRADVYEYILESNPKHPISMTIKADYLNKFEEYEQAIIWYDKALEADPTFLTAQDGKEIALSNLNSESESGGCLIATATYNSELAPQVQFLREIRDNTVMSTASGTSFMTGFNQFYYSFSPTIADLERENLFFKEIVRISITPMISTLSIIALAENGNDIEVLGLGMSVIVLNLGMYIGIPVIASWQIKKRV